MVLVTLLKKIYLGAHTSYSQSYFFARKIRSNQASQGNVVILKLHSSKCCCCRIYFRPSLRTPVTVKQNMPRSGVASLHHKERQLPPYSQDNMNNLISHTTSGATTHRTCSLMSHTTSGATRQTCIVYEIHVSLQHRLVVSSVRKHFFLRNAFIHVYVIV